MRVVTNNWEASYLREVLPHSGKCECDECEQGKGL